MTTSASPDVFILGAGFSHGIHPEMPLLADLTSIVAARFSDRLPDYLRDVADNFEELLSYLADGQPWLTEVEVHRNRALYLELTDLLRDILEGSQSKALAAGAPGWLKRLVRHWTKTHATVVTLNYDWLIESTYLSTVRAAPNGGQPASPDYVRQGQLYAFPLPRLESLGSGTLGIDRVNAFRLLKLHGSLNWWYSGRAEYYGEVIYDGDVRRPAAATERYGKMPLIVPPTATKNRFFSNELVQRQWRDAFIALMGAHRVHIVGYSLPETDHLLKFLVKSTCARKTIVVADPSEGAGDRYKTMLPEANLTHWTLGAEEWADYIAAGEPLEPLDIPIVS